MGQKRHGRIRIRSLVGKRNRVEGHGRGGLDLSTCSWGPEDSGTQRVAPQTWDEIAKPSVGYNYRIEVSVDDKVYTALLDTGASTNAVPEELVVCLINQATKKGFRPQDKEWLVILERRKGSEAVSGVARGQDLEIIGSAVTPVGFKGLDKKTVIQNIRFNICSEGLQWVDGVRHRWTLARTGPPG